MYRPAFALGIFAAFVLVALSAFAQTAPAPAPATIAVLPVYQAAEPYLLTAFGILFSALLTWGLAILQKRTGIAVNADMRAKIQDAATNGAGRILAAAEGDVSKLLIPAGSPLVAAEAQKVVAAIPDALDHFGITPAAVGQMIAGKIGVLQASATAAQPTVKIGA